MAQYGESLATTIAHATHGQLLHQNRIELAVIATDIASYPEVSGVVFYDATEEVLAMAGSQTSQHEFSAHATMDDSITGYVAVALNPRAFVPSNPWGPWVGTLAVALLVPLLVVLIIQFSQRGNRSLPIVSVPEPDANEAQVSFGITVNLHNALALGKRGSQEALEDALQMAQEVCALYAGFATIANSRGILLLFCRNATNANQAISAGFLLQELLAEYETAGEFRCYLHTCHCPQSPADLTQLDIALLGSDFDFEHTLTMAALARPMSLLVSERIHQELAPTESDWLSTYNHPLLEDGERIYAISRLPEEQAELVEGRKTVILGFSGA